MRLIFVVPVCLMVFLSGCMVGPDYSRPETAADECGFVNAKGGIDPNSFSGPGRWWEGFADDATVELVEKALANNYDIKEAAARVLQARGAYAVSSGKRLPEIDYSADRVRTKSVAAVIGRSDTFYSTFYDAGFDVSYVADVFGKLKRAQRAAWDDLLAADSVRKSICQAIVSDVVKKRVVVGALQKQYELAMDNTSSWENTLETIERRYSRGLSGALDVRLARENLNASRANEKTFERLLNAEEYLLDTLVGQRAGTGRELPPFAKRIPSMDDLPEVLPAWLLDNRPDVQNAEYELAAATERVGVSIAQMLPDLTISANYGYTTDHMNTLFDKDFEVYSLILKAMGPLFKGGQLKAEVEISKAVVQEKCATYAKTILNAIREVETILYDEYLLRDRLVSLEKRLEEARASERLARGQYFKGLVKLITVLETERRKREAEIDVVKTYSDIWQNRVDLYVALGGDWNVCGENGQVCQKSN